MRIINFLQKNRKSNQERKISSFAHNIISQPCSRRGGGSNSFEIIAREGIRQNACQSFLNYLIFFRSSQIGDFLIKDILFIPVYPLSLYISSFLEKKNPPVCLNGLRHHTPNSIYLYLLLISQLKPFRSFIRNHALEL